MMAILRHGPYTLAFVLLFLLVSNAIFTPQVSAQNFKRAVIPVPPPLPTDTSKDPSTPPSQNPSPTPSSSSSSSSSSDQSQSSQPPAPPNPSSPPSQSQPPAQSSSEGPAPTTKGSPSKSQPDNGPAIIVTRTTTSPYPHNTGSNYVAGNNSTSSSSGSDSSSSSVVTASIVVGSIVMAAAIGIWIFRKWKLSPSRNFKEKIQPVNFEPGMRDHNSDTVFLRELNEP